MNILNTIKNEIKSYKKSEIITYFLIISVVIFISTISKDSIIALISALCGISYTIFAGYGKIYCYFIGLIGTLCYCYLAYTNSFWGNLFLYAFYYFPIQIIGIFCWMKHLKKDKFEITKTQLKNKERILYLVLGLIFTVILYFILKFYNDKNPFLDSFSTIFSIFGQFLTVKRCLEQWYIWFFVNLFSLIMWINAILNGAKCIATVLMWLIYFIFSIYFLKKWSLELKKVK